MEIIKFSDFEKAEYSRLKAQAKQGWLMFAEAIKTIHGSKLYRLEYSTFEEFCERELGIAQSTAYQFLSSSKVMQNLKTSAMAEVLPATERQTRPLTKLEPEVQKVAWAEVVETIPEKEITAAKIEKVVDAYKPLNEEVKEAKKPAPNPTIENPVVIVSQPLSEKEILQRAKELKEKRAQDFLQKKAEKLEAAVNAPMPEYEAQLIEKCKAGETVVINMNAHLHIMKWAKDAGLFQQIDRYSEFGNPFYLGADGDREFVCDSYKLYLDRKLGLHEKVMQLKGKVLGCHCHPERCHGDEIVNFINAKSDE